MAGKSDKLLRCAIYTRKSTEHGLELEFNSLHAQREACEAYIKSQIAEGWRLLPKRYDDPAYSGGNLDRPALQKLLKDIEDGQVDVVVVYKIDRLTRSLTDFARVVEIFDARSVSFVAVTQQFNTTTSMGRLTLNVLLSFAQFERELASERVRDKVAASRRKGKWTGGSVPLGYDSKDKRLVVNPGEAKTVRMLFEGYLAHGTLQKLITELDARGIVTKKRPVTAKVIGGIPFTYGSLANLLKNRTYLGETGHDGKWYPGEHQAIIERGLFDKVQHLMRSNSIRRSNRREQAGALLAGLLFDDRGNRMSPSYSVKQGVRYPFYVSSALLRGRKAEAGSVPRVSATEIETVVLSAVTAKTGRSDDGSDPAPRQLIETTVARVVIKAKRLDITFKSSGRAKPAPVEIPWAKTKRHDLAQIDENTASNTRSAPNPLLVQAIVRAHMWLKLLTDGTHQSIESLAKAVDLHPKVIRKSLRLSFLAPDITQAVLMSGRQSRLSLGDLDRVASLSWDAQQDDLHGGT